MRRKKMQRVGVALAAALLVGLTACGGDDDGGGSDQGEVGGTLKVASQTEVKGGGEAIIKAYQAARPEVKIQASYAGETQYDPQIKAQLAGSGGPDVFLAFAGTGNPVSVGQLEAAGAILDLSDQPWVDDIPESMRSEVTFDGKTYLYPLGYDPMGIVIDRRVWEENGVEVPTTFSDLLASCDVWRQKGLEPIAVGMKESFVPQFITYALIASTVYRENPDFDAQQAEGESTFSDSGWKDALDRYVELEEAGCFNEGYNGTSYDEMLNMVTSGKAAMTVTVSASLGAMRESNPDAQIEMVPFPTTDNPEDNWVGSGVFAGYAVNADTGNEATALDFLEFINTPEMSAEFQAAAGAVPLGANPDAPGLEAVIEVIQDGRTGPFPDHFWPNPDVQATHNAVVQQIFTGQTSIEEALEQLDAAYAKGPAS
jgi:raffinose/stachyose/melibiose transport system substrate-binding protein